ncbi:hypothetical protein [Paraburkholderia ultramafica]|nr:hypothetical protein [Paraburkholderia ultramafica]
MALGHRAEAVLDRDIDMVSIRCRESGLTARMHAKEKVEVEYYRHDGTLIVGAWMAVQIQCSAEQATELVAAIGSPAISSFEIVG